MAIIYDGMRREAFSHIDQTIYMNHCAIGPIPDVSKEAAIRHLEERSSGMIDTFHFDEESINGCRSRAAELINSPSEASIALISNTSHGLNLISSAIPWQSGDEIIVSDLEFPANVYPWIWNGRDDTSVVKIDGSDGAVPIERIEAALTPNTRVVAISAVQFLSGYRADLEEISRLCRKHGIYLIVDAIQAAGCCPLDVDQLNIDALVTGGHKWLLGPQGLGFMYLSEEFQTQLNTGNVGWLSVEEPWQLLNTEQQVLDNARRFEGGMYNGPGVHVLSHSLELLNSAGINTIYRHITGLQDLFLEKIGVGQDQLFGAGRPRNRSGIMAFRLNEDSDSNVITEHFKQAGISVSSREGILRIAPHLYNTQAEIERVADIWRETGVTIA